MVTTAKVEAATTATTEIASCNDTTSYEKCLIHRVKKD